MFYLIQFFKTFTLSPIKSILFWLCTCTIVLIISFSQEINLVSKSFFLGNERPYFYILVENNVESNIDLQYIKRFKQIEKVNLMTEVEMGAFWEKSLKELNLSSEFSQNFNPLNYLGLQIFVKENVSEKSFNELKDELKNYLGEERLTFSPLNSKKKKNDFSLFLIENIAQTLSFVFLLFWFIFFFSWAELIKKNAYLIEKFSRRKKVGFKVALIGLLFLVTVSFIPGFALNHPSIPESVVVTIILLLSTLWFLRSWKWSE